MARPSAAGFRISYTDRDHARTTGRVTAIDLSRRRRDDAQAVYVSLEDVARDECSAGQASTVVRSNYRTLHRRFPGVWTDLASANVTALGAFAADLPPALVDVLCGLQDQHPVLDEDDPSDLEH